MGGEAVSLNLTQLVSCHPVQHLVHVVFILYRETDELKRMVIEYQSYANQIQILQ